MPAGVTLRPQHDGSPEHEEWARWAYEQTGDKCPDCLAEFARREAAKKASSQAGAEPIRVGNFRINPKGGR